MTKQEIKMIFEQITNALEQRRLKQVFDLLNNLFANLQNWQLQEKTNLLEDTYKSMLRYLTEGINDPAQQKIYDDIIRSLYEIADKVVLQIRTSNDNSFFYERRRMHRFRVAETSDELIASLENIFGKIALISLLEEDERNQDFINLEQQKEMLSQKIFYRIWLSNPWTSEEKERWTAVLNNQLDSANLSFIITAITLNLMETFDERKAIMLFEAIENANEEIKERAYTGIVLFLRKYNNRLPIYMEINNRLKMLDENPQFIHAIRQVLLQFIVSKETEKITNQMINELLPEMMKKVAPKMKDTIKWEEMVSDSGEKNPEWEKIIEESGLHDKLQELSELQLEGADVMLSSFIHLKNYTFFNEFANWFMLFSAPSDAIGNKELTQFANILTASTLLCNSDKYSFFLSVSQMPENYKKMMMSQFATESDAVKEMLKGELPDTSKNINYRTRQYIQDLYRFYKLHPRKKDFEDIFEIQPEFYKVPSIYELIKDDENLLIIGEYYFNKNYFQEAVEVFTLILEKDPNNDILYQKKGYCLQMTGKLVEALDCYLKAELLNTNNSWTIKKLAYCYRMLKNPEEALHYYKKAEQFNPENLAVQLSIGHCYLELKHYDEALKYYFKVEYLDKNKEKAWRPIAWTSFLMGKYEQAMTYCNKIISHNPNAIDYLNTGHTQLALGNYKPAILFYELALNTPENTLEKFLEAFNADIPDLLHAGVKANDIPFILDSLSYDMS
jgi:tetratricopeptide (TPR) repeat protein